MGNACSCSCCSCCHCCTCCQTPGQPEIKTPLEEDRLKTYLKSHSRPPQSKGSEYISEETILSYSHTNFILIQDHISKPILSSPLKGKNPATVSEYDDSLEENLSSLDRNSKILEAEAKNLRNNENFEISFNCIDRNSKILESEAKAYQNNENFEINLDCIDKNYKTFESKPRNNENFEASLNNLVFIQEETKNPEFGKSSQEVCIDPNCMIQEEIIEDVEQSSKFSQEFCKDSHCFVCRQDLVFAFMLRKGISSGPVVMKCSECFKRFSRPGFECSSCRALKCGKCGLVEGLTIPELICSRNDPLVWSVDSWAFSIEFNGATRQAFVCSVCRKTYQEPAYTCHKCFYYLCIGCSGKKGLCPPMNLLKCPDNDLLSLNPSPCNFYHCSQCQKHTKEPGYFCKSCTYSLCKSCSSKLCLSMLRHPGLYCKNNHTSMILSPNKSVKLSGHPNCLSCGKSEMTYVLSCYCGQRLCLECGESLQTIIEECIGKEISNKKWVKWYKLIDLYIAETKICNKCEGEIVQGVYFYDNTNDETCYCYNCIMITSGQ